MLQRAKTFLKTRTGHLAMTYLAIIMAMTVIFSVVIFAIASNQFDRPLPPKASNRGGLYSTVMGQDSLQDLLTERANEARLGLFVSLLLLNSGMLLFGVWFSAYLARLTMEPIEEAMEEQARFVSDASHELRTPLTALQSMNEVTLRRKKIITDKEARELATANVDQAAKLHTLTSSLLGLVTAGRVSKREPVELQPVVGDVLGTVVAVAQQKDVTVDDQLPALTVMADRDQLAQVIRILVDNAIKYSLKGGTVQLTAKPQGNKVKLSVIDQGVGIAAADLPHIFSRFYRADSSRSKEQHDGYGIGLSIAKSISDHMHWNISVESEPDKGSTFSIELPLVVKK